ncbi:P-loop NTPase fold protein [Bradyrhizobium sp. JYMT SZCCT0180]|uniref:P-loop NTPase fold protein n=1 Tax=Bradyrhizobium sp. JYMT SZCCT0180 TaxID=2807666 RepID=UPI001BA4E25E|nr:P-loop NTPase fold protein [Bradyrhizobium sp. JYMT SZCCT0180]MBR1215774.1 hypothetical protein [Bradyrhizobium sp. JYMT SZCCT0180]
MMLDDLVMELDETADWRRRMMKEYPSDLRNETAAELLERLSRDLRRMPHSELLDEISNTNDLLQRSSEQGRSYDLTSLIEECNAYRKSIGFSETPPDSNAYLARLLAIYKTHQELALAQPSSDDFATLDGGLTPTRIRMQGNEADAFELFSRNYGLSDSVLLILGRAFDVVSGYADRGVRDGVQPLSVFLCMLERGTDPLEKRYEESLPVALATALKIDHQYVDNLLHKYLGGLPQADESAQIAPSTELVLVLNWAKRLSDEVSDGESVAARHLLAALLTYFVDFPSRNEPALETTIFDPQIIRKVLNDHLTLYWGKEPTEHWQRALNNLVGDAGKRTAPATGGALNISRQANDDELCLNVDDYADALAQLFSRADDGEFCFAVYGHWGRGKTFLMQRMKRALVELNAGYHTIHFSAWRYPTAPEVWVHLYETFAKEAFERPWYTAVPNIIRTAIAKHRGDGLLKGYALFALGIVPLFSLIGFAGHLLNAIYLAFGITGGFWLWSVARGVRKTNARLSKEYLTATRHTEKLGLQATIGFDLRALLIGWLPKEPISPFLITGYWIITAILLTGTWLRLTGLESLEAISVHFTLKLFFTWNFWGAFAFEVFLVLVATAAIHWIRIGGSSPRRIVLVVDDLDRCKPEHLLSVMESIKLLIEDPEISRRVQVTMLLEEEILKHAIFEKYGALTDTERAELLQTSFSADRLMRENCEKLFTASIRLPKLTKSDVKDLVETFSGRRRRIEEHIHELDEEKNILQARMNDKPASKMPSGSEPTHIPVMRRGEIAFYKDGPAKTVFRDTTDEEIADQRLKQAGFVRKAEPTLSKVDEVLRDLQNLLPIRAAAKASLGRKQTPRVLEEDEVKAVSAVLTDDSIQLRDNIGPRSIRAFLFRYQLARLLLTKLDIEWHPSTLARELASQFLATSSNRNVATGDKLRMPDAEKVKRIVEEVS